MSRTFSTKNGSVDSLKFSCKWGLSPKARQMRTMAFWVRPVAAAMERVLQWVACGGRVSRVRVTTASTCASVRVRGGPERGASRERLQTALDKALTPFAHRLDGDAAFGGHRRVA